MLETLGMTQEAIGAPYVRYYVHPDRILGAQQAAAETRAAALLRLQAAMLAGYESGAATTARRGAVWYLDAVLPFLDGWLHGSTTPLIIGLPNDGRLPGIPNDATVEFPSIVPGGRDETLARPLEPVRLPPLPAAILAAHAAYETLAVEAILAGSSRGALVRALLANPLVTTFDQASGLVDAILTRSPR